MEVLRLLAGGFDHTIDYNHSAPSPEYFWYRKRRQVLSLLAKHVRGLSAMWRGVELGCGPGVDLYLIRKKLLELNPEVNIGLVAIDGADVQLQNCRLKKSYYHAPDVNLARCDLSLQLPFRDRSFDFAYCSEVLEHLLQPDRFLFEVHRILKSSGLLLLTTPNEPNLFQRSFWKRKIGRQTSSEVPKPENADGVAVYEHISLRTISEWRRALASAGFESVDFERGALAYQVPRFLAGDFITGIRFCLEGILDLFPKRWTYKISDQMIALFRKL
jgi:ubiquinone/menaquinone biosynthesis C-methylase UbiE